MATLISAGFRTPLPIDGAPTSIVYIPEGISDITPFVDGKAKRITIDLPASKGVAIAAKLQMDLEKRQGENVRPWVDFEHKAGKSAGNPSNFSYVPGEGIVIEGASGQLCGRLLPFERVSQEERDRALQDLQVLQDTIQQRIDAEGKTEAELDAILKEDD